nr:MAG TPA: DNA N-6-adenine-methyltransferase [Bacteriophage sp.]
MTEQQFDRNTWQTPKYVFHWLNLRFKFDIDGCANGDNALVKLYFGDGGLADDFLNFNLDALKGGLSRASIFVNPPYSNVTPFIKRAKVLCNDGHLVVMLLNNDKSTRWYQNHIHGVANEVIDIVGGRIAFIHPVTKQEIKGNSKGQMIVVFDPATQDFVQRSVSLDFVKKVGGYNGK